MRLLLKVHPGSRCLAAINVEVDIGRAGADRLVLTFLVTGSVSEVHIPHVTATERSNDLWHHTCFEAFVGASSGPEYYEFNFAPSTLWAAYRFNGYRSGMRLADEISAPPIDVRSCSDSYTLQTSLELDRLSSLPRNEAWRLGLAALIEDRSGRKSYWALAHPPGKPDFHHADCFAHKFFPAGQP